MPESFASRLIAAHQAGVAERRSEEQHARQADEIKLAQQHKKLELDALKLQAALHERQIQGMTSGGPTGQATTQTPTIQPPASAPQGITPPETSPDLAPNLQQLLMQRRMQPVASQPMPIQGMSQSVETGTPPALPDIPVSMSDGRSVNIPGTNKELTDAEALKDFLTKKSMELQLQREANSVQLPQELGGGSVDKSIAPSIINQSGQNKRQSDQQDFTAGENQKRLKAESDRAAADRASRESIAAASRLARVAESGKSAAQSKQNQQAMTLGNRFDANPVVKQYAVLNEAVTFANGLAPDTKNPADDIGLIYAFAKAMDPNSVVREGEYATVERYAQSWADKFGFDVKRLYSNTNFLTTTARENMKATILAKAKASETSYNKLRDETAKKFKNIGEDPTGWITDYNTAGASKGPQTLVGPNGATLTLGPDGMYH